jgi:hypothetical protein
MKELDSRMNRVKKTLEARRLRHTRRELVIEQYEDDPITDHPSSADGKRPIVIMRSGRKPI